MINKSESIPFNVAVSSSQPSKILGKMGRIAHISNASDMSIAALPLEMIYHIGSFLDLNDKVHFNQSLENAGLSVSLNYEKMQEEFKQLSLAKKIDILLEGNGQHYDFAKFHTADAQAEEATDLYSLFFNDMCEDFKKRKHLAEEIAALVEKVEHAAFMMVVRPGTHFAVEVISPAVFDVDRIKDYVDRESADWVPDNTDKLIDYLFPDLAVDSEIRQEIAHRIGFFQAREGLGDFLMWGGYGATKAAKNLLAFLKMKKEHRGIPIEIIARKQKVESSHLLPIIEKISEKMQAMRTEELRALLIMAADRAQQGYFCEKMIELGVDGNPFYSQGSPYFSLLKSDLLYRVDLNQPEECRYSILHNWNSQVFTHHIAYNAHDEDLREYASVLLNQFLGMLRNSPTSPYRLFLNRFYDRMEGIHSTDERWRREYLERISFMQQSTPTPIGVAEDSSQYILSNVAKRNISFANLIRFLQKDPNNINVQDSNGDTLVHLFIKQGDLCRLTSLVDYDHDLNIKTLDLNIKNNDGITPLMLLVQLEDIGTLNFLLEKEGSLNLDVNQCDDAGNTALHYAIMLNRKVMMHRLLAHEATDRSIVNKKGKTPFDLAESTGLSSMFRNLNLV